MSRVPDTIRQRVRQRAAFRCEYCRKPEGVSVFPHQVEHIIALKHGGSSEIDNLAWACVQCNTHKGTDLVSFDPETSEIAPLYNPRKNQWDEHFEQQNGVIAGKTPVARTTVRLLQMNDMEYVETRRRLIKLGTW
jgi:5-methylcytosine-specific restriction endonuclease McrA